MNTCPHILYLDDDPDALRIFEYSFSEYYHIHTVRKHTEALDIISSTDIKVVITDQKMPDIRGTDFIQILKLEYPDIICIMLTGHADKPVMLQAINTLDIFWFIEKPWKFTEVKLAIDNAIERFDSNREKAQMHNELQLALERARQSDRLKAEFLGSISHEIRTPVNGIVGFTSLIRQESENTEVLDQYYNIVMESAYTLIGLVDDMITASRIRAGDMRFNPGELYLNDLLDEIYDEFAPQVSQHPGIELIVRKRQGEKKIPISADKEKLYNIFIQLLRNALKFTDEGCIEFGVCNEKEQILFVRDEGSGISDSDKPIIFDFFKKGRQKPLSASINGMGVGLSIVKGLVELMNGEIWYESESGKGTVFYFRI